MKSDLHTSYRFCAQLARREARNFYWSFILLPPRLRRSMCALYAFMRHSDDIADAADSSESKSKTLTSWRNDLAAVIDSQRVPDWHGFPALLDTVRRHQIPPRYLFTALDGVAMDIEPRPFPTFADLHAYCYRVASVVGLSCLHIWGFRSENGKAEAMADSCGVALQLTNILRDLAEDTRAGRLYIPLEDLNRFGVDPAELANHPAPTRVRELLAFQADRSYDFYRQAAPLAALVDPVGRPVLGTIVGIYRSLLDEIVRAKFDVLSRRVSVPAWRKGGIALRAFAGGLRAAPAAVVGANP